MSTEVLNEAKALRAEFHGQGVSVTLEQALLVLLVNAVRETKRGKK